MALGFQGFTTVGGSVYEITQYQVWVNGFGYVGQPFNALSYFGPASAPAAGSTAASTATGVNPVESSYSVYGKTIPLSVLGRARIGGLLIVGPWIENGLASFGISFGVPADPTGSRTLKEIAFDSQVVWDSVNGFSTESFTYRFYPGTYTQAADALESAHFPTTAHAYRPQMMLFFSNLPLANTKFGKIPFVAAVIEDDSGADVNLGEAFERLAASPWCDFDQFETTGITDVLVNGGLIFAAPAEFLPTIQQFGRFYRTWDILQTDKLRIVDRGSTVTADITLDKSRLMGKIVIARGEPNSVPRKLELSTIDPDADYTIVPSTAQRPLAPVAVTTSVATDAAYLPVVMDSSTRLAVVTYAKYAEEQARKKITGTAMMYGLELEPGALVEIADLGDEFVDETFKVIDTMHGINYAVEFTAESILKCTVALSDSEATTPAVSALWAVSRSRVLVPGYAGAYDLVVSGRVQTLYDQSGNGHNISASTSARRPIATTSGPNSRECCDFSPTSLFSIHGLEISTQTDFATPEYIVVSIRPDTTDANRRFFEMFGISSHSLGMRLQPTGKLDAYNQDTSISAVDVATSAAGAVPIAGNPVVVEWRHEGGVLYQRVNGAGETSVASGTAVDISRAIRIGSVAPGGYDGKVFEAIVYDTAPTLLARDALVADMMAWVGA